MSLSLSICGVQGVGFVYCLTSAVALIDHNEEIIAVSRSD